MKYPQWSAGRILYNGIILAMAVIALVIAVGGDRPDVAQTATAVESRSLPPAAMTENNDELMQQLSELKRQLARLAGDQQAFSGKLETISNDMSQIPVAVQEQNSDGTDDVPVEILADAEPPAAETVIAGYQQILVPEAVDPDWTYETETAALELLEEYQFADTELNYTECYQRACRLEFDHPEGIGDTSFVDILSMNEAFAGDFYITTETEGGINRTVMFVARAGETLPKPDQY